MALTVKQLNSDASFLLSLEPVLPSPRDPSLPHPEPFTILLDPWLSGPATIFHPKVSFTKLHSPACVSDLSELPEPDLVIISQHRSDHCSEPTLRQLPGRGTGSKTRILAEPAAARVIRGWKHFEPHQVRPLERWDKLRPQGTVAIVPVPPVVDGGAPGEVTVTLITPRRDITGLHGAIGITYKPPSVIGEESLVAPRHDPIVTWAQPHSLVDSCLTRPASPKGPRSPLNFTGFGTGMLGSPTTGGRGFLSFNRPVSAAEVTQLEPNPTNTEPETPPPSNPAGPTDTATAPPPPSSPPPPPPPIPPRTTSVPAALRAIRSLSTIVSPIPSPLSNALTSVTSVPTTAANDPDREGDGIPSTPPELPPKSPGRPTTPFSARTLSTLLTLASRPGARIHGLNRPVSIIFSPHGTSVDLLEEFTTHCLIPRAAVPLTLLLHCFDRARNPWFLGGEISLGAKSGALAAARLGARAWISAHDGDKEVKGMATGLLKTKRWGVREIEDVVAGMERGVERERMGDGVGARRGRSVTVSGGEYGKVYGRESGSGSGSGSSGDEGSATDTTIKATYNTAPESTPVAASRKRWWGRCGMFGRSTLSDATTTNSPSPTIETKEASPLEDEGVAVGSVSGSSSDGRNDVKVGPEKPTRLATRVMALGVGEEVILTSEGVWDAETEVTAPSTGRGAGNGSLDFSTPVKRETVAAWTPIKTLRAIGVAV